MALQRTTVPVALPGEIDGPTTTPSLRTIGTGPFQAAAGNHNHAGAYASTLHASTHLVDGSDPLPSFGTFDVDGNMQPTTFIGQTVTPSAPIGDDRVTWYFRWMGYRPVMAIRSVDREMLFGSPVYGPGNLWLVTPNTGTSAPLGHFGPVDTGGTFAHAGTTGRGWRTGLSTAASAGATAYAASTDVRWTRGDSVLPFCGYFLHARISFPDASYANTGASTGVRFFVGMTDQSVATMLASDNPAGHRHGIQLVNVNGGKTQTNFQFVEKNGTTETLVNSTIAITQNHVYDFYIHIRPNGGYAFFQVDDRTAGTSSGSVLEGTSPPGGTTFMRAMAGIQTVDATARRFDLNRLGVEVGP